jgi:hypothetical protein
MEKIHIAYWHGNQFKDLPYGHNTTHDYSLETRNQIIDTCLEKGYSVMIRPASKPNWEFEGILIWIDNGRFGQR